MLFLCNANMSRFRFGELGYAIPSDTYVVPQVLQSYAHCADASNIDGWASAWNDTLPLLTIPMAGPRGHPSDPTKNTPKRQTRNLLAHVNNAVWTEVSAEPAWDTGLPGYWAEIDLRAEYVHRSSGEKSPLFVCCNPEMDKEDSNHTANYTPPSLISPRRKKKKKTITVLCLCWVKLQMLYGRDFMQSGEKQKRS